MSRIWFHGTNEAAVRNILNEGFKPGTYFAAGLEDALEFGGNHVFMVALDLEPGPDWQIHTAVHLPVTAIVRLTKYTARIIVSHPDRLAAVFDANQKAAL